MNEISINFASKTQLELFNLLRSGDVKDSSVKFALSLSLSPSLSATQAYWVDTIIQETKAEMAQKGRVNQFDFGKVHRMFLDARQKLKRPKITLLLDPDNHKTSRQVRFSISTKDPNIMWITVGAMGTPIYGRINLSTNVVALRSLGLQCEAGLTKLLKEFTADPVAVTIRHGKLTGQCCFCSIPLSDPRSLHVGYGEICAQSWRLPWGAKSVLKPTTEWIAGN